METEPTVSAVSARAPAVLLVAVDVLLDFGVGVHTSTEDSGGVQVITHYGTLGDDDTGEEKKKENIRMSRGR